MGLILGRLGGPLLQWFFAAAFVVTVAVSVYGYGRHAGSAGEYNKWFKKVEAKTKEDRAANFRVDQDTLRANGDLEHREQEIRRNWATAGRGTPASAATATGVTVEQKGAN